MSNFEEQSQVYIGTNNSQAPKKPRFLYIFIILFSLLIITFSFVLYKFNINRQNLPLSTHSLNLQKPTKSKITLTALHPPYSKNSQVPVYISYISKKDIDGIDIELKFDNNILEASSGAIFTSSDDFEYPKKEVIQKDGIIRLSAINSKSGKTPALKGTLGTVVFTAKNSGEAQISLLFSPDQTTDTNIVSSAISGDVLDEVENLKVFVK